MLLECPFQDVRCCKDLQAGAERLVAAGHVAACLGVWRKA